MITSQLCPALLLPVELTTEIFLHCAPTLAELQAGILKNLPPLVLTRVCRDWRHIAVSIPDLWQKVHMKIANESDASREWCISFLQLWLSRARNQPLFISVSVAKGDSDSDGRLVQLLESRRAQWREISLNLPLWYFLELFASTHMPLLRRIELDASDPPHTAHIDPITAFEDAPALEHLSLGLSLRPSQFELPFNQLTSLTFANSRPQDLLACLRQTPRLVSCTAEVESGDPSVLAAVRASALSRLTHLALRGANLTTFVLRFLTLPALESLGLAERSGLNTEDISLMSFFLDRSVVLHTLRALRLYFVPTVMANGVLTFLESLPALEKLEIDATEARTATSLFMKMIAVSDDDRAFLPQLQTLSITLHKKYDGGVHEMLCGLCDVLQERSRVSAWSDRRDFVFLSAVMLQMEYSDTTPADWMLRAWRAFKAAGVTISVHTKDFETWV
ncbi:hypothetical protein C8F01DRAFT_1369945 [Mycena amicta]|nr:hypothetical protein C8F01DRAFT_1369945 [Mycena amicta]